MSILEALVGPIVRAGGALFWRRRFLAEKDVEAALGVLEALDRFRGAFHDARRHDPVPPQRGVAKWREPQMLALQEQSKGPLLTLHEARVGLRDAEAKAVSLWGEAAKEPLQKVYPFVELLTQEVRWYTARVMDAGFGDPSKIQIPQPSSMMVGHSGDELGRNFEAAVREAEAFYERKRGRAPRAPRT